MGDVHEQIKMMVLMLLFFVIPAAVGMMILSAPLYTSFYSYNEMGIKILLFYAPVSIAISLFTITCSIVQGIDKQNLTLYVVLIMLAIKAVINIPLIMQFQTVGAVMGTGIALSIGVLINFLIIKKYGEFPFRPLIRPLAEIVVYSLVMLLVVEIIYYILMFNVDISSKTGAIILMAVAVPIGGLVYMLLSFKTGLADEILGSRADKIRKRLKVL
jgi:O-antigen/teichoic acid export membrane protein